MRLEGSNELCTMQSQLYQQANATVPRAERGWKDLVRAVKLIFRETLDPHLIRENGMGKIIRNYDAPPIQGQKTLPMHIKQEGC